MTIEKSLLILPAVLGLSTNLDEQSAPLAQLVRAPDS